MKVLLCFDFFLFWFLFNLSYHFGVATECQTDKSDILLYANCIMLHFVYSVFVINGWRSKGRHESALFNHKLWPNDWLWQKHCSKYWNTFGDTYDSSYTHFITNWTFTLAFGLRFLRWSRWFWSTPLNSVKKEISAKISTLQANQSNIYLKFINYNAFALKLFRYHQKSGLAINWIMR